MSLCPHRTKSLVLCRRHSQTKSRQLRNLRLSSWRAQSSPKLSLKTSKSHWVCKRSSTTTKTTTRLRCRSDNGCIRSNRRGRRSNITIKILRACSEKRKRCKLKSSWRSKRLLRGWVNWLSLKINGSAWGYWWTWRSSFHTTSLFRRWYRRSWRATEYSNSLKSTIFMMTKKINFASIKVKRASSNMITN